MKAVEDDNLWKVSYSLQLIPVVLTTVFWLLFLRTEPVQFLMNKAEF